MIVIDASVAVKWFLPEVLSDAAEAVLREDAVRIAPEHLLAEVGQVLLKAYRVKAITLSHAHESIAKLAELVHLRPIHELAESAIDIAVEIGCTNYDALYVAAAQRWHATLVTTDEKLVRQLRSVRWPGRSRLLGV